LRSNLGYALQQRHDFPAAIAEYRSAISLDEKLVSAWLNLGAALALTGERAEARRALEQAKKLDPTDPRVKASLDELRALEQNRGPSISRPPVP
jgi:Flp pilus assembly protein TadD